MKIRIKFRDTQVEIIDGVTGSPTEVDVTFNTGFYRDQFTIDSSMTGVTFPGTEEAVPVAASLPVPAAVYGRLVPGVDPTIARLANDTESSLTIASFKSAVSDEIAHAPLRQVTYVESFWAFPCFKEGIAFPAMYRKVDVSGWGPEPDDE